MITISENLRLRKIAIDTGDIYIIDTLRSDGTWLLADSSVDNAVVTKRLVEWGVTKNIQSALDLINQDSNECNFAEQ